MHEIKIENSKNISAYFAALPQQIISCNSISKSWGAKCSSKSNPQSYTAQKPNKSNPFAFVL